MPHEDLKRALKSLHVELSRTPSMDAELRALLIELANDIDDVLHPAAPAPAPGESHESLLDRVTGVREQFEATHPQLAAIIGRVAEGLSQLGI